MASTNFVDNSTVIYAAWLNDVNNAVYNGIFAASSISPSNLVCNGSVSGSGFTGLVNNTLSAPGRIGNSTPNTGAFTTLTATSLTGLTTPLSVGQGGTGLSAVGTSGNILTSNGTAWVSSAPTVIKGLGLGGETWHNVTSSRASGTAYQNTNSYPIQVSAWQINQGNSNAQFQIGATSGTLATVAFWGAQYNGPGAVSGITGPIVPPGYWYAIITNGGGVTGWWELY
jgi:hypothetical protein